MFKDRQQAAEQLVKRLLTYKGQRPLVLAIPRGAVPMAKLIAQQLDGDFDVVLVRKLRAPHQSELAIGSVDERGWTYLAPHAQSMKIDEEYLECEKQRQLDTIGQRRAQYSPIRPSIDPGGRVVIVVDDGMATGSTMMAALHGLRQSRPKRLICAVPVAPAGTVMKAAELADEVVCLETPPWFQAVGQFYLDFPQIEDAEVIAMLKERAPTRSEST